MKCLSLRLVTMSLLSWNLKKQRKEAVIKRNAYIARAT